MLSDEELKQLYAELDQNGLEQVEDELARGFSGTKKQSSVKNWIKRKSNTRPDNESINLESGKNIFVVHGHDEIFLNEIEG